MADPRTFVLIGEFKDGITPELAKINNQLAQLQQTFSKIGGKGARTASRDLGKFNASVQGLNNTLQQQNKVIRSTIEPMRQYRREVGKTVGALKKLDEAGGRSIAIERTNKALQEQIRLMDQLRSRRGMTQTRMPREPRLGRGGGGVRPPRGGGRGGDRNFGFEGHMAEFGFAYTLGNAISQPIQNAIVSGFQIGVGLMTKPFQYFAQNLGERVQDELSDLKAAGGFFSIAQQQQGEKFIKSFDQAVDFTQENNKVLAKLAASLPGSTQDYIEVSKRISDSVARTVMTDQAAAIRYAEELRRADPKMYGFQAITGTGQEAQQRTIQTMLAELTKKTVLAGQGGRAGTGGPMGAYGLPQLTERMLSQDEVSMGQFQRYSAIFSDPMIMDALAREIPNINKTAKNSVERFKALQALYDRVLPPELVARYRRTFAGITETFNTAIFGPETGLFGLGRKMEAFGKKMNEFGEYVDKTGKVVKTAAEAMDADLSIYDMFRDTVVNIGQVLSPIVENLDLLWDPLRALGMDLKQAREITAAVLRTFHGYIKGWEEFEEQLSDSAKTLFQEGGGSQLRAALSTITNLLAEVGAISDADFSKYTKMMEDPAAKLGPILQELIDKLLNSDVAKGIGEMIGNIVGTVLVEVAKVTGFISGRIEKSNQLVSGFQAGFKAAGGEQAFSNIFKDVFKTLFNVFKSLFNMLPWQAKLLGAMMIVAPAVIQGLSMLIAESIGKGILAMGKRCAGMIPGAIGGACPTMPGGRSGMKGGRNMFVSQRQMAYARLQRMRGRAPYAGPIGPLPAGSYGSVTKGKRVPHFQPGLTREGQKQGLARITSGFSKALVKSPFGKTMTKVAKFVPGGVVAAGVLDMGLRMMSGQGAMKAAGGALFSGAGALAGGKAGAAIGTFFGPGVGTVIGGAIGTVAGGLLGDKLFNILASETEKQNQAAANQILASQKQMEAANTRLANVGLEAGGAATMAIADPMKLNQTIEMLGLQGNAQVQAYQDAVSQVRGLADVTGVAKDKLFTLVEDLKKQGYTAEQIWKQEDVKVLQARYVELQKKAQAAQKNLNKTFEEMPQQISRSISYSMAKMDTKTIEYAIANRISMMPGGMNFPTGKLPPKPLAPGAPEQWALGNPFASATGSLGDAVAREMRMKPPGSDLVIANSSETVIPAAGGYGMLDFVETLRSGFNVMVSTYKEAQKQQDQLLNKINTTLVSNQKETNTRLQKLETKFSTPGMTGGLGGGAAGGVDAFTGMAQRYGLSMTSAYRPGDPGYHGSNRARDYSNGTGPTPQMLAFAQSLASNYGANLKELIYTPLGFSIKNGQKVPPYAQGSHYNHVHVAYALGYNNGRMFTSLDAAQSWENSMVPGSVKVASITGNSAEGFGGETSVVNNITINQQPGQDADELASIVALKIGEAVADARAASIFV